MNSKSLALYVNNGNPVVIWVAAIKQSGIDIAR
jgi:hypothetical protein